MQTVFAIIRTKLRKDALEVFDTEIATINCYFRSNLDNANDLKDAENYPIKVINYLQAAGAWHASATAEGTRINPNVTDATAQKGFRDVFDENFTRDSVQLLNQKEFLKFNFYKNLDWSDDSGLRKQINQYKKLKQLSNWQWTPNFFGGNYIYLVERMPKNIAQQITLTTPIPNNKEDFFRRANSLFRATRVTIDIVEKSKNEKTNHYSQRTQKINNDTLQKNAQDEKEEKYTIEYNQLTKTTMKNKGKPLAKGPTPMVHKYNNFKNNKGRGRPRYNNNNRNNGGRRPQNSIRKSFTRRRKPRLHLEPYNKKGEISWSAHQLDTTNQPKIYLIESKSCAASYLARKTSAPGKSKKNLPLAPNVDSKNLSPNIVVKNKLITYTLNKTNRTPNNQLHINNNMILGKAVEPNTSKKKKAKPPLERKPKQEFSKENIKQNEEVEETLNKVLPSKKGKKKEEELPKDQLRKMGQIIKQKLNRLDKAIVDGEIAKDTKIEQTIQDLNWRLEQINKTYSYTQGLTEKEIEEYLESIQKVTKIKDTNKPAETRREYLYEVLSTLNETNDATIWKHREDIKELQKEYNRDIHGILGIIAEEFNDMGLIEQQAAVIALITAQAHCKDGPTKQALYEKHKEFLESQLEKVGDIHDDTVIQRRIYGDVIKARKREKLQILLPDPHGRNTYKPYEQYDIPRDKEFVKENERIRIRIPHSPTDDVFLNKRLSQTSRRNEDIPQGVLTKVTKFFEDVGQGIKNKFTTPLPLTPTPTIENNDSTPDRKRNKRGYTPSPDPYERKQQRYKSPRQSSTYRPVQEETEKERIKILQEKCGNKVWKILGDVLTEYIDEFREKQEMRTFVNNNVIPDIQFILNKKEHEISDNDKNQGIRKYTVEEEKIIKELCEDLEKNNFEKDNIWVNEILEIYYYWLLKIPSTSIAITMEKDP
ncbi:8072_t:CDS:2, partial [Dentiscutata erythropus]